ncbi:MAG: NAD-dependent epimerase/dehydratase family protein [Betaproteobacteria bacterium]|nr:NAD-dependent epimerase/dehydratase family protein [Betaproteobacteria bacterium]
MTTLVTGATGFVGSAVVRALLARGHHVRALVRPLSDRRNLLGLKLETAIGDLTDRSSLYAALRGCRALFHVAADYRLWVPNPVDLYRTNVEGTRNIMEVAAELGIDKAVYTSSVATLGAPAGHVPADEATPVAIGDMIGHYKRSKFLAEEAVRNMAKAGLPVVIVNPSTPVGPRDLRPTPTGRVIRDMVSGRIPAYVDTGLNIVHVDDVAAGHLLAFENGVIGERYILGGENLSLRDILTRIAYLAGRRPPRICLAHGFVLPIAYFVEAGARLLHAGEPLVTVDGVRLARKRMYFSSAKAARTLGFEARPAAEALSDAVDWFVAEAARRSR